MFEQLLTLQTISWLHGGVFAALTVFSAVLAYAAHSIEETYVRRKLRVVESLDGLMRQLEGETLSIERLAPYLRVAGDSDGGAPDALALRSERSVGRYIYGLSLLALLVGLLLVGAGATRDGRLNGAAASPAASGSPAPQTSSRPNAR